MKKKKIFVLQIVPKNYNELCERAAYEENILGGGHCLKYNNNNNK